MSAEPLVDENIETELIRRGLDKSDAILIFLAKRRMPDKYGDKSNLIVGPPASGNSVNLTQIDLDRMTDRQLDAGIAFMEKLRAYLERAQAPANGRGLPAR
jgi:hypothetical protein